MSSVVKGSQEYLANQYRSPSNLNARISLHQRFSVNPYGWQPWVFDQLILPPACRLLELGCGPGNLWIENLGRVPAGWEVTLSDFSAGMLQQAQRGLNGHPQFQFKIVDASALPLPFGDESFDGVIANHMLYHIPDKPALLAEIQRILKPGGHFYASTIGGRHLAEIVDLITRFDRALSAWNRPTNSFTLENGAAQLAPWFNQVNLYRYEDNLEVTDAAALSDYILSMWMDLIGDRINQFRAFVDAEVAAPGGVFHITKDSGIFTSTR